MRKILTWAGVIIFVVGATVITFWPVNHWRLYDANWKPLALTQAENYCAGKIGIEHGFNFDDRKVEQCEETHTHLNNTDPSITNSTRWACQGIQDGGWDGQIAECIQVFLDSQIWLTDGGGFTRVWNDQNPRPQAIDEGVIEAPTRDNRSSGVEPYYSPIDQEDETE